MESKYAEEEYLRKKDGDDFMHRPMTEGYKTTSRFNIANYANNRSQQKGFTSQRISFYTSQRK
jgi:hypothetical protein